MKPLYIRPLKQANSNRKGYTSVEDFYTKHPPCRAPGWDGIVLHVPSPLYTQEDVEKVIAKIREVTNG